MTGVSTSFIIDTYMERKQLIRLVLLAAAIILLGAVAFVLFEHISATEGLYRTASILLSHHDDWHMENWPARLTTLALIVASLVLIAYLIKILGEYIIGLGDGLKRQKTKRKLLSMKDHYIVCGLGRVGRQVARELAAEGQPFVAMDQDEAKVKEAVGMGYTAFVGDATQESELVRAKLNRAKGLVASLGDDSSNLFVTLTARQLNPNLFIVSRANREENVSRMLRAGADKVAMPNQIGGFHMATMLMRPHVIDVLDVLSTNKNTDLQVQEIMVPQRSHAAGNKLEHVLKHSSGVTILALNNIDGVSQVHPSGVEVLYPGDKLIAMGTKAQLESLEKAV